MQFVRIEPYCCWIGAALPASAWKYLHAREHETFDTRRHEKQKHLPHRVHLRLQAIYQNADILEFHSFALLGEVEVLVLNVFELALVEPFFEGLFDRLLVTLLLDEIDERLGTIYFQLLGHMEFVRRCLFEHIR